MEISNLPSFVGSGTAIGGGEEGGRPWKDVSRQGESKRSAQVLTKISRFFKKHFLKLLCCPSGLEGRLYWTNPFPNEKNT